MNGQTQELLKALKEWHDERHNENLKKFEKIFKKLEDLPCGKRNSLLKILELSHICLWATVLFILSYIFLK